MIFMKFSELKLKEVICAADGERLGYVSDMEIDEVSGAVRSLITVPWNKITKIGDDLIIINRY